MGVLEELTLQYANELSSLKLMGFLDQNKNLRYLRRLKSANEVCNVYLTPAKYEGIYIGDRVTRGPDWKWGDQDGGVGHIGTVSGLRQWHPSDPDTSTTAAVVLWDHGYYGNYRFGYKSAFDLEVVDRAEERQPDQMISVGERVQRYQGNWRWGDQDGGAGNMGTVIELYASPAPFEGGCRVAVLWDHEQEMYLEKATEYLKAHPDGDAEWCLQDDEQDEKGNDELSEQMVTQRFAECDVNPHRVRKKRRPYVVPDNESDEDSSDWDEPDFEEILSRPIPKYRWLLPDPKSPAGVGLDIEMSESKHIPERRFLMIDDRVRQSAQFKPTRKPPKRNDTGTCFVLKVEQSDPRRVLPDQVKGDRVWTTWSSYQSYRFQSTNGRDDIVYHQRGNVFNNVDSRVKVGDRVRRGMTWKNSWGDEDGGHEAKGTIVCLQYVLKFAGILAKVRWDVDSHTNFYSWGFKDVFDIRKTNNPGM